MQEAARMARGRAYGRSWADSRRWRMMMVARYGRWSWWTSRSNDSARGADGELEVRRERVNPVDELLAKMGWEGS
jgi:hypothetical protein